MNIGTCHTLGRNPNASAPSTAKDKPADLVGLLSPHINVFDEWGATENKKFTPVSLMKGSIEYT